VALGGRELTLPPTPTSRVNDLVLAQSLRSKVELMID